MAASTLSCETVPKMLDYFIEQIRLVIGDDNSAEITENSYFSDNKQVEAHTGQNIREEDHEEPLVIDIDQLQEDILQYYNVRGISTARSKPTSNTAHRHHATPVDLIQKIKKSPPDAEIADAFFELCTVAACTGRNEMMKYMKNNMANQPFYQKLEEYLNSHFYCSWDTKIQFGPLRMIGNLLLCGVPDYYCHAIPAFRKKLGARNVFDADIIKSSFSLIHKRICIKSLEEINLENAKVCGFIMCQLMIGCIKDRELPNIDFLTDDTTALTEEERNLFISNNCNDLIQFD